VIEQFGDPHAVLIVDETSFPKQGCKSAGVQIQYCGTTKRVENCQVGVFLAYASRIGHTFLDRELYLPLSWTQDHLRCVEAGIPEQVRFQTKCELARQMIERAISAQVPFSWIVADSLYGSDQDLREWIECQSRWYVLAVRSNEVVGVNTPDGLRRLTVSEIEATLVHPDNWQRLSMSEGTKGPRLFDWVRVPILHQWEDDGQHWLLIRRQLSAPFERTYYLVYGPQTTTLQEMVCVAGARWHIEEVFESAKGEVGLDHYEVRTWTAWHRHYSECSFVTVRIMYVIRE
jgi:SRSO17 transposase